MLYAVGKGKEGGMKGGVVLGELCKGRWLKCVFAALAFNKHEWKPFFIIEDKDIATSFKGRVVELLGGFYFDKSVWVA